MATMSETKKIVEAFARAYELDLDAIGRDDEALKATVTGVAVAEPKSRSLIYDAPQFTDNGNSAYVPDLEDFDLDDVSSDNRLVTARVEQNLEEASRFSESCLTLRREYGEMAKVYNDTKFKAQEFFRLDLVHLRIVHRCPSVQQREPRRFERASGRPQRLFLRLRPPSREAHREELITIVMNSLPILCPFYQIANAPPFQKWRNESKMLRKKDVHANPRKSLAPEAPTEYGKEAGS